MTIKTTEDGRMLCPNCLTKGSRTPGKKNEEIELHYHQTSHRRNSFIARFDEKGDMLYIIGDPLLKGSDTLEVYDEYLHCPHCNSRHNVPWSEDGDTEQDQIEHEGDFLRAIKPETPAHQCPKCGGTEHIHHVEEYEISRKAREPVDDFEKNPDEEWLIVEDYDKIEYDGGGKNEHLECYVCHCRWSIPANVQIDYE